MPKYKLYTRKKNPPLYTYRPIKLSFARIYTQGVLTGFYGIYQNELDEAIKNENISNQELAEELQKPIIRQFKNRKVHSTFIDNIWEADLADMQLISKFIKGIRFLLCY